MNKKNVSLNGGVSLILLVFVVIMLISFSSLSLVSANADRRLTDKYEEQTTAYYTARNAMERFLASLDRAWEDHEDVGSLLAAYEDPAVLQLTLDPSGNRITAIFQVTDTQVLTCLAVLSPDRGWTVESDRLSSTQHFTYDQTLHVMDEEPADQ